MLTDKQIQDAVFAVLRKWNTDRAWDRYTRESGPYDVTSLRPEVLEIIRAVLAASPSTTRQQEVGSEPALLFDGYYVYSEGLTDRAKQRTSPENVADVLDAVVRLMRAAPSTPENAGGVAVPPTPKEN